MRTRRLARTMKMLCCGALLLQAGGCAVTAIDLIQTALLGITAAGGVAILRNI